MNIIDVNEHNVEKTGFFCKMSGKKTAGYQRKLAWLKSRFSEGLRIKMLDLKQGGRGFIEYIPGEYAWRPVNAHGHMFIHCLWVVGKSKGKGFGSLLLENCFRDAKESGAKGVAMITFQGNWLSGNQLLLKHGFTKVDSTETGYDLMFKDFESGSQPSFPQDWDDRLSKFGKGLVVIRSDQCPYLDDAVNTVREVAHEKNLEFKVIEFNSGSEVQKSAPSPYGVFSILFKGKILSHYYLLKKDLLKRLDH